MARLLRAATGCGIAISITALIAAATPPQAPPLKGGESDEPAAPQQNTAAHQTTAPHQTTSAQDPTTAASDESDAARAEVVQFARADAREGLRQTILHCRVTADATLDQLLAQHGISAACVEELTRRAAPAGAPVWYPDGSCETFVKLPAGLLRPALGRWFAAVTARQELRWTLAVDSELLASGAFRQAAATGGETSDGASSLALLAARLDAESALSDQVRRLKLGSAVTVADLIAEQPRLAWALRRWPEARVARPTYAADGTCTITAALTLEDAAARLAHLLRTEYQGRLTQAEAARRLPELNRGVKLSARGAGRPPPRREAGAEPPPEWIHECLTITVQIAREETGKDAPGDSILTARRQAEFELTQAIEGLDLGGGGRVVGLIRERPAAAEAVSAFIGGAIADKPVAVDGGLRLTLRRPLRCLPRLLGMGE